MLKKKAAFMNIKDLIESKAKTSGTPENGGSESNTNPSNGTNSGSGSNTGGNSGTSGTGDDNTGGNPGGGSGDDDDNMN
jgi:hypothetical protein